jgi:UDP-N-acetylmuramate dehydrogenase
MDFKKSYSLQSNNSFNIDVSCSHIYLIKSINDLDLLPDLSKKNFYILGEGSNTLFVDSTAPVIIKASIKGIFVTETYDSYIVNVGAGENWHEFVCYCIKHGINGLENLALIPGSVGAAPVQNIGAYGVEFEDLCLSVSYYDLNSKEQVTLLSNECGFKYRDSIFKSTLRNKALITNVTFTFPKKWQPKLTYNGLDTLDHDVDALTVMNHVVNLRESKLPDPQILPNAGSFFKNPIVTVEKFNSIQMSYPNVPRYVQVDGSIKLAAAWLIEQSGLKGFNYKGVGVDKRQALVLVNYGNSTGKDLIVLAKHVQAKVLEKFDVRIIPEVRMISSLGEVSFQSLSSDDLIGKQDHE